MPTAAKKKARSSADVLAILDNFPISQVKYVSDGDTLVIANGWWSETVIRLDSIDCPEGGQDWGDTAKYGLIKLVGGQPIVLEEHGLDPYGRTLATIYVRDKKGEWLNVNERMVMLGHAWVMRAYYDHLPKERQEKLNRLETWAKSKKVGLWLAPNPTPPWQWRKRAAPRG